MFSFSSPAQRHRLGTGSTGQRLCGRAVATLKEMLIVNTAWRDSAVSFWLQTGPLVCLMSRLWITAKTLRKMENGFVVFMKLSPYLSSQDWLAQRELPLAPFPSVWMASMHMFRLGEAWLEADFFVTRDDILAPGSLPKHRVVIQSRWWRTGCLTIFWNPNFENYVVVR